MRTPSMAPQQSSLSSERIPSTHAGPQTVLGTVDVVVNTTRKDSILTEATSTATRWFFPTSEENQEVTGDPLRQQLCKSIRSGP